MIQARARVQMWNSRRAGAWKPSRLPRRPGARRDEGV